MATKFSGAHPPNSKQYGMKGKPPVLISWKRERRRLYSASLGVTSGRQWVKMRKAMGLYVGAIDRNGMAVPAAPSTLVADPVRAKRVPSWRADADRMQGAERKRKRKAAERRYLRSRSGFAA